MTEIHENPDSADVGLATFSYDDRGRTAEVEMTKSKLIISALIAGVSLGGCGTPAGQPDLSREQAVEIARNHAAREIPGTNLASAPSVRDGGTSWIVSFNPPAGFVGGATRIEIDKRTRAVVNARAEQ